MNPPHLSLPATKWDPSRTDLDQADSESSYICGLWLWHHFLANLNLIATSKPPDAGPLAQWIRACDSSFRCFHKVIRSTRVGVTFWSICGFVCCWSLESIYFKKNYLGISGLTCYFNLSTVIRTIISTWGECNRTGDQLQGYAYEDFWSWDRMERLLVNLLACTYVSSHSSFFEQNLGLL